MEKNLFTNNKHVTENWVLLMLILVYVLLYRCQLDSHIWSAVNSLKYAILVEVSKKSSLMQYMEKGVVNCIFRLFIFKTIQKLSR